MYISSKINCKELASKSRIDGDKEYKVDCLIVDYLFPNFNSENHSCYLNENTIFKSLLQCDEELYRDGGDDKDRVEWYREYIKKQLMKLDDISLTFLINTLILIDEK